MELVVVMVDHGEGNRLPPLTEKQVASLRATLVKAAAGVSLFLEGREKVIFDGTYVRSVSDLQEPNHTFCLWRVYGLSSEQAVEVVLDVIEEVTGVRPTAYAYAPKRII